MSGDDVYRFGGTYVSFGNRLVHSPGRGSAASVAVHWVRVVRVDMQEQRLSVHDVVETVPHSRDDS